MNNGGIGDVVSTESFGNLPDLHLSCKRPFSTLVILSSHFRAGIKVLSESAVWKGEVCQLARPKPTTHTHSDASARSVGSGSCLSP